MAAAVGVVVSPVRREWFALKLIDGVCGVLCEGRTWKTNLSGGARLGVRYQSKAGLSLDSNCAGAVRRDGVSVAGSRRYGLQAEASTVTARTNGENTVNKR